MKTAKEIELETLRVELIRTKTKLRQASSDRSIADIYESFEEDLKRSYANITILFDILTKSSLINLFTPG